MNVILFDEELVWKNLLPLTYTRPNSEIRIGILTVKEKWDITLNSRCSYFCKKYLQQKYPLNETSESIFINSKYCPTAELVEEIKKIKPNQSLYKKNSLIAFYGKSSDLKGLKVFKKKEFRAALFEINYVWDIFQKNDEALKSDFRLITKNKKSKKISKTVTVIGDKKLIFLEDGAKAEACILNTTNGPIYIGKNAEIMEGTAIRGPFAMCESSTLKLNSKIYGATTIGPYSKIGGEISNSIIFGYSNKAHDGFIGNSVIGEWCNLGADTNTSNLKNNYGTVKLFNYKQNKMIDSGLQFLGLIMADHCKSGINTMFNSGTVVGVGSNIYGGGFPPSKIPNFSWGGSDGFETYQLEKLIETAEKVFNRRNIIFNQIEREILKYIFNKLI